MLRLCGALWLVPRVRIRGVSWRASSLQDYDRHNVKKVTVAQAIRAINTAAQLELSSEEIALLKSDYGTADGLSIRYLDFCDDVDSGLCSTSCFCTACSTEYWFIMYFGLCCACFGSVHEQAP